LHLPRWWILLLVWHWNALASAMLVNLTPGLTLESSCICHAGESYCWTDTGMLSMQSYMTFNKGNKTFGNENVTNLVLEGY
jgi:hypothetical protein